MDVRSRTPRDGLQVGDTDSVSTVDRMRRGLTVLQDDRGRVLDRSKTDASGGRGRIGVGKGRVWATDPETRTDTRMSLGKCYTRSITEGSECREVS